MDLYLDKQLQHSFVRDSALFDALMALKGEVYRCQKNRKTQRIQLGESAYFIKQHTGTPFKEMIKNLLQLRMPILDARCELRAIQKLQSLSVLAPQIAGYGERGEYLFNRQSFILLKEIAPAISLEELCKTWKIEKPHFIFKQALITEIARIARILHGNGINHRDFYLCHFLLDIAQPKEKQRIQPKLYLIDLHRAQIRHAVPARWVIKDLAGLYFSSKEIGLTQRDLYRFIKLYRQMELRQVFTVEKKFWKKVKKRAEQLYRDHR